MTVDFQQLVPQIRDLGENAAWRETQLKERRAKAHNILRQYHDQLDLLQEKVKRATEVGDPHLRCAFPTNERLDQVTAPAALPSEATVIAADGSQINPDRHARVDFSLINVGAVQMEIQAPQAPKIITETRLIYIDPLDRKTANLTDRTLALTRDLEERAIFLRLVPSPSAVPVISFTDGPLELWGSVDPTSATTFQTQLKEYLQVLRDLRGRGVVTAGYVDKPGSNLVVRLLEVASTPDDQLGNIRQNHPLQGATDLALYSHLLPPGNRSAVFGLQSRAANDYEDQIGLHFFYLNVGRPDQPHLARVEIPAWVANDSESLEALQAVLVAQCQILGLRTYPYLLHRAHEAAVVTRAEKDQIAQMIIHELLRRGVEIGEGSQKQATKDLPGRGKYRLSQTQF